MAADTEMADENGRERSRSPLKGAGENPDVEIPEAPRKRPRNGKTEMKQQDQEEMDRMEAEWQAQETARKRKAAQEAAKRLMASKRYDPPLFRDADGDQANEFWEETVPGRGNLALSTTNIHEVYKP
ncbi:unnamed protein product [Durusdinium trenchii]|uniref:Uncharacterized protein n=1 Tax=Durusdinium trenchii TaxID=1381693 RepID=A0ABP0L2Y3_9DINO